MKAAIIIPASLLIFVQAYLLGLGIRYLSSPEQATIVCGVLMIPINLIGMFFNAKTILSVWRLS